MKIHFIAAAIAMLAFSSHAYPQQNNGEAPDALAAFSSHAYLQQDNSEAADGYHLLYWLFTGHLQNYTEWWYFNVYDSRHNVQAIFSYLVNNPFSFSGGLLPIGISEMVAAAYTPDGIVTEVDPYLTLSFSASYRNAEVNIRNQNTVAVIDADTYRISGTTRNGRMVWDLLYQRDAPSWAAANNFNVAADPWQLMSWLVYMPRATVSGTLKVDGKTYHVQASGYHDHNWGEWNLNGVTWNWAQYSQAELTFDLGDFPNKPGGIASLYVNGRRYVFASGQYTLIHTKWAYDFTNNLFYPTQSMFHAANDAAEVDITMDVLKTDPLSAPLPPPKAVIYEQTATYAGQCWIGGKHLDFKGDGFKEYTAIAH